VSALPRPLAVRTRLVLVSGVTALAVMVGVVGASNLLLHRSLDGDATSLARARAAAALQSVEVSGGSLSVSETPDQGIVDAPTWIVDERGRVLEHPPSDPPSARRAATELATARSGATRDVPGLSLRLAVAPVVVGHRRLGAAVAAISLTPYARTERLALEVSLALGATLLLLSIVAAHVLARRALQPVSEMTQLAREWSERDPNRRFSRGTPHDELTALADTLDELLGRVAGALRHEQRFSAELAHELRTPLTRILGRSELALRRERSTDEYRTTIAAIHDNALGMRRTIDALMAAARHEASPASSRSELGETLAHATHQLLPEAQRRGISVITDGVEGNTWVPIDDELLLRIVSPLLDNACAFARSSVRIRVERTTRDATIAVSDDGPGVAADEMDGIFEPGVRGAASRANGAGAGLGLALSRRLARSAGGDVVLRAADAPGAVFEVRLPRL
jgi:signal transduction histidine kinase